MAISSAKPTRSISLPARLHPNSRKIEAQLNRLKTNWESPSSSPENPLGSEAILSGLADLVQLYSSTEELIQSHLARRALLRRSSRKSVEKTLDGSIALLDTCGAARDLLQRTKENVQALQSSLRRKASVENDIKAYLSFRKSAKREIAKSLGALKAVQINVQPYHSLQTTVITVVRELSAVAISILRRLFVFFSSTETKTKGSRWALISKLVGITVLSSNKGGENFNEAASVDISLGSFHGQLRKNGRSQIGADIAKRRLEALAGCVDGIEAGIECLFRCLIQHRVSLLNLLTP